MSTPRPSNTPGSRLVLLIACVLALGGCGRYARTGILTDPELQVPAEMALRSAALGIRDFRASEGVEALCVGWVSRRAEGIDDEALRIRRDFERAMARRIEGAAPVVVPAEECFVDTEEIIRVRADGTEAISLRVIPALLENHRTRPVVQIRRPGRGLNRSGALAFRLVRDDDGWWLDQTECAGGFACTWFDRSKVIWGMGHDGTEHSAATVRAAFEARRRAAGGGGGAGGGSGDPTAR